MKRVLVVLLSVFIMTAVFSAESLAVATFDVVDNAVSKKDAETITELYVIELAATGKVNVIDRTNFDKILKEMNFQNSDWSDRSKFNDVAEAVNTNLIAHGQIRKFGSKTYVTVKIINSKTAGLLYSERKDFNSIDEVFGLAFSFANDAVVSLTSFFKPKIGDVGPGGGIVFYVDDYEYFECIELGKGNWVNANSMCSDYRGGGYDDWYLPSLDELNLIYQNLAGTGYQNVVGTGKITSFKAHFWSSFIDRNGRDAWAKHLSDGSQLNFASVNSPAEASVMAVRAFYY